jgi:hypothetical protein
MQVPSRIASEALWMGDRRRYGYHALGGRDRDSLRGSALKPFQEFLKNSSTNLLENSSSKAALT